MGFRTGSFCTVWDVKQGNGRFMDVRISISRKDKQTNEFVTDFSGYCRFVGNAGVKAEKLKMKDRIKLGDVDVTNKYDKEKKTTYTNYVVFDFDILNSSNNNAESVDDGESAIESVTSDDDLPF